MSADHSPRRSSSDGYLTAALRTTGLVATALFEGATNGERFRAYVADTLVPMLWPSDTVVLDNLPVHKVTGIREAVEAAGARLLFLPPYSPDFNPIENAFAKLRALLRHAAERTVESLRTTIVRLLATAIPAECTNFFATAGYNPTWSRTTRADFDRFYDLRTYPQYQDISIIYCKLFLQEGSKFYRLINDMRDGFVQ